MIATYAHGDARKNNTHGYCLESLSDKDLLKRLEKLRGSERAVLLKILRCLNEVERRRLYVLRGYATLYEFCTDYLKYSRSAAMRRIHAARCIERFPQVAKLLRSGELTLTVVAMISRILTIENADEIISYAEGRSTREVEMLVARHRPGFVLRDRVKPICLMVPDVIKNDSSRITGAGKNLNQLIDNKPDKNRGVIHESCRTDHDTAAAGGSSTAGPGAAADGATNSAGCNEGSRKIERVIITQKFKLEFAVDSEFMEKLSRVRSLLSTKYPKEMDFQTLFNILMEEFIDRHSPEKRLQRRIARKKRDARNNISAGNTETRDSEQDKSDLNSKPVPIHDKRRKEGTDPVCGSPSDEIRRRRKPTPTKRIRYIPPAVRDEVFTRDGGRCTFVGDDGKRCDSDWNLQIDHIIPFAKGGDNSPDNLRVLCARHNISEAEREYGVDFMKRFHRRE